MEAITADELPEAPVDLRSELDLEALDSLGPAVFVAKSLLSAHLDFRQSKPRPYGYATTIATEHALCFAGFGPPPVQIQEHYFRVTVDF